MTSPLFFMSGVTGKADIGFRFFDSAGDWSGSRVTSGVFETDALNGTYGVAAATIPSNAKGVHWDSAGTASIQGDEIFDRVGYATITAALGTGTGVYPITITVTDGTDPLQNVSFSVYDGSQVVASGTTDASGNSTLGLDAGTFTVLLFKNGYTFGSTTRTVTGAQAGTLVNDLEMTALPVPSAPSDPAKASVYGYVQTTDGATAAGLVFSARLVDRRGNPGVFKCGSILATNTVTDTTALTAGPGSVGLFSMDLYPNASILPSGSRWEITNPDTNFSLLIEVPSAGINVGTIIT